MSDTKFRAVVITLSDKGAIGERPDTSGPAIMDILRTNGYEIAQYVLMPDDRLMLSEKLKTLCDEKHCELIITTGGTGFSERDITPEATRDVIEREAPGIAEAIRANSMVITKRAMLSRGVAGIRKETIIINLPGSEKAVRESMDVVIDTLEHAIRILIGKEEDCGR